MSEWVTVIVHMNEMRKKARPNKLLQLVMILRDDAIMNAAWMEGEKLV